MAAKNGVVRCGSNWSRRCQPPAGSGKQWREHGVVRNLLHPTWRIPALMTAPAAAAFFSLHLRVYTCVWRDEGRPPPRVRTMSLGLSTVLLAGNVTSQKRSLRNIFCLRFFSPSLKVRHFLFFSFLVVFLVCLPFVVFVTESSFFFYQSRRKHAHAYLDARVRVSVSALVFIVVQE